MPRTDRSHPEGNSMVPSLGIDLSLDEYQEQPPGDIRVTPVLATVYKRVNEDRANSPLLFDEEIDLGSGLTGLSSEPDDTDWHIVCRADAQEVEDGGEAEPTEQLLLWTQFSQPIPGKPDRSRYLRCTSTQLPNFRAWLSWQHHHPTIISTNAGPANLQHNVSLTQDAIQQCQQQLISALQPCSSDQRSITFMIIYCVANSIRGMYPPELTAAATVGMLLSQSSSSNQRYSILSANVKTQIGDLCQSLLHNPSGMIEFTNPAMKTFVSRLRLANINPGHSTMAQICLEQIRRLGAAFIIQPWYGFLRWFDSVAEWPLLRYVAENWFLHYRLAPESGELNFELYHLLRDALLQNCPRESSVLSERKLVDAGYGISRIYQLSSLEAIFRNMGARTTPSAALVLGEVPTKAQWERMKRDSDVPLDFKLTMHEDEEHDAIIVDHEFLHLRLESLQLESGGESTSSLDNLHASDTLLPAKVVDMESKDEGSDTEFKSHCETPSSRVETGRPRQNHLMSSGNEYGEISDAEMN